MYVIQLTHTGEEPGEVSTLQVAMHTSTAITINWTVSGFIDQFNVTYSFSVKNCSDMGGPRTDTILDGSTRSHTLRDLNEDSIFTITVRAINTEGSTHATVMGDTLTSGMCINPCEY
jgi:FlaG/FlaF family flagellin (archaellin)